ncbi:uncharacterized protein LOC111080216 [Drosophila obscura]|uniref:uncharacterized protein LOC111080216 n=1 Tax=Drosophila obscura TaxID=7282 RepID=UPI001BB1FCB1|nr:uncharacterized protein LOC111080216 [Drosophila obscura]XP_041450800.1 uncharacterized protein LOC111080216 [Drosophila obscura]
MTEQNLNTTPQPEDPGQEQQLFSWHQRLLPVGGAPPPAQKLYQFSGLRMQLSPKLKNRRRVEKKLKKKKRSLKRFMLKVRRNLKKGMPKRRLNGGLPLN